VSVFFRWGIFGILGVAGLMYAYNASKQLAAKRTAQAAPVATEAVSQSAAPDDAPKEISDLPQRCQEELIVAQRARVARAQGEPLDRVLRIQEIAFKEPPRRARLEKVATYWFKLSSEPHPEDLRDIAIRNCLDFK
jgi:hypothetical protein